METDRTTQSDAGAAAEQLRLSTVLIARVLVMAAVADAANDVRRAVVMTLNIFGKEALQDLGEGVSSAFAFFFLAFPLLWYTALRHAGPLGKAVFGDGCGLRVRADIIGQFKPCMTDIYIHIDARTRHAYGGGWI